MKHIVILSTLFLFVLLASFSQEAQAACANPVGAAGDMIFNSDYAVLQWCDGTDWNGFPKPGPISGPNPEGAGCVNPVGTAGDMVYNSDFKVLQWCDGTNWIGLPATGGGTAPCVNPAGDPGDLLYNSSYGALQWCNGQNWWGIPLPKVPLGFFVMTSGTYTGNLGGLSGANTICLNELTSNSWKGKTAGVTLTAANVRAWLCGSGGCQDLTPGVVYKFARAGDSTKGGNYLYSDSLGRGSFEDANSNPWSGTAYFGLSATYWSGRNSFSQTTDGFAWEDQVFPIQPHTNTCSDWASTATNGQYGQTNPASCCDERQWSSFNSVCSTAYRLVCIVDPVDTKDRTPANPGFTNITNAEAGVLYTTTGVISGIDTDVTAIINSVDVLSTVNWRADIRNVTTSSAWGNRVLVKNGDTIELRMNSDLALGAVKTVTVSIGSLQFNWTITNRSANPQGKVGYFALTKATFTGNIGGLAAADAACLEDLQSQLWYQKGKISASATNVRAFLCDSTSCNNFQANTKYEFAGLGSSPFGGAGGSFFYTDANGNAPNVAGTWGNTGTVTAYSYWGDTSWWTGRAAGSAVSMSTVTSGQHCTDWSSTAGNGTAGTTTSLGSGRWNSGAVACTTAKRIACILDPPATGFGFDDVNDAAVNTLVSKSFTFSALTTAVSAVVDSGIAEIRKNSEAWGATIASLNNGDTIEIRMLSSAVGNAAHIAYLTVGDAKVEWIVRTKDDVAVSEQKIQPGTGTAFGSKVARYKTTMAAAVGSTIYIYLYSGGTWTLTTTKTTAFGGVTSLAIDDDTLAVGYKNYNPVPPPPYYPGGIAIWQRGATWTDATELVIPSPDNIAYTYFGTAVATYGNFVVGSGETGKVYIYENTGTGWASATVTARTTTKNIYYTSNQTMVMKGNTLVIGTHPVNTTGQVEVIENTGSGWGMGAATVSILTSSDASSNDKFGSVVDISEDESTIVVGAPAKSKVLPNGQNSWEHGSAYIFEKIGTWSLTTQTRVLPETIKPSVRFGSSVAISGNIIGVGSAQALGDGATYLYKKTSTWTAAAASAPTLLMQHLTSTNAGYIFDEFGYTVSLCGSVLVTGAPYSSEVSSNRGYVYSHDLTTYTGGQTCL